MLVRMTASVLEHNASGRSWRALLILSLVWMAIMTLWVALQAAGFVVALLMLATLPAAWDFANGRQASLRLDSTMLRWRSGRNEGEIALSKIEKVRFETRLDLSVRVRIQIESGRRITLPQDCLPDPKVLMDAFAARDIPTERHHFVLIGS